MQLPLELRAAIDEEAAGIEESALSAAVADISETYRGGAGRSQFSNAEALAYALARLPATYAVAFTVLGEAVSRCPRQVRTLLDLGAGPGTVAWAANEVWPSVDEIILVEREPALIDLGKRAASASASRALREARWMRADFAHGMECTPHDAVIFSYSLGELDSPQETWALIDRAWKAAREMLILIEPGTPGGFALIRSARARLVELGAKIAAPCPHDRDCPMPENDWCHFAARVERTALHRRLKKAELNYEDEKFSYVVATKTVVQPAIGRIIRRPVKRPGLIQLALCTAAGLREKNVRKRDADLWRRARKAHWGDEC